MSKKKLNKKGQQARAKAQQTKTAPRINPTKEIYDVDAKVQAYSASECAEEAQVDLGVITEGTEKVDPVTDEVIDVVGTPVDDTTEEVEEDVDDTETVEEDGESIDEDLDEDGLDDYDDDEEDDDEEDVKPKFRKLTRTERAANYAKVARSAVMIDAANENPLMINTESYGNKLITSIHRAKNVVDTNNAILAHSMRNKKLDKFIGGTTEITFSGEFINWDETGYLKSASVMDALEKQYNNFIDKQVAALNDTDVDGIYYCNDLKLMTSGALMHTGVGMMPITGRVATVTIYVPEDKLADFIREYTTPVCVCQTSDKIPAHILALAAEGLAPIDGIRAYHLINIPKFLKLFEKERGRNIRLYNSDEGYSMLIANGDGVTTTSAHLNAPKYATSLTIGMLKTMCY